MTTFEKLLMTVSAFAITAIMVLPLRSAERKNATGSRPQRMHLPVAQYSELEGASQMPMPRVIKIVPQFWADPRLRKLEKKSASYYEAAGKASAWFSMAASYFAVDQPVPDEVFETLGIPELEECGFAVRVVGGYRAKGDHEHFAWIKSQQEKAKKGGQARWKDNAPSMPQACPGLAQASLPMLNDAHELRTKNEEQENTPQLASGVTPPCSFENKKNAPYQKFTEEDLALANDWIEFAKEQKSTARTNNPEKWADVIRKMREIDHVPPEELRRMLMFVRNDDFWMKNAISVEGLRNRGNGGLLKHENIRNEMNRKKTSFKNEPPAPVVPVYGSAEEVP